VRPRRRTHHGGCRRAAGRPGGRSLPCRHGVELGEQVGGQAAQHGAPNVSVWHRTYLRCPAPGAFTRRPGHVHVIGSHLWLTWRTDALLIGCFSGRYGMGGQPWSSCLAVATLGATGLTVVVVACCAGAWVHRLALRATGWRLQRKEPSRPLSSSASRSQVTRDAADASERRRLVKLGCGRMRTILAGVDRAMDARSGPPAHSASRSAWPIPGRLASLDRRKAGR
jgi:hypothetical protein